MDFIAKIIEWTKLKCRIQLAPENPVYFKEREIWWASIGANIGSEQNGKHERFERPVLIVTKFHDGLVWGVPATSQARKGRHFFTSPSAERPQTFILSQMRAISPKRFVRKQRVMPESEFNQLRDALRKLI